MKPTAETVYSLVRRLIDEGADAEKAADRLLQSISKAELGRFVRPALVEVGRRYERRNVREVEQEVDRRIVDGEDPISARRKLMESAFPVPGVGLVLWADATVEQHNARAKWQRDHASASLADAERHDAAVRLIEERGVACLRDLLGEEGAA